jgi:Hypothetical protein (DUF2513).
MKLDWELIREILLKLEELPEQEGQLMPRIFQLLYDWEKASYHIKLLLQAGLIEAGTIKALGMPTIYYAKSLILNGHEFLNSIRNPSVWNKVKERAREVGISLTLDIAKCKNCSL